MKRVLAIFICITWGLLQVLGVVSAEEMTVITLLDGDEFGYSNSPRMQNAISLFSERNPGYEVRVVSVNKQQMITYLMSGDMNVDIIPTYDDMYTTYLRHGLLCDLMPYPGFRGIVESWIDIKPIFMKGNSLYSVPFTFLFFNYKWNEPLGDHLGIDVPNVDMSWSEFERLLEQVRISKDRSPERDVYLLAETNFSVPACLWQYTCAYQEEMENGKKKYNDPELKNLLVLWKQAIDKGLFYTYSNINDVDFSKVLIQNSIWVGHEDEGPFVCFPILQKRSCPVVALGLGVFSGSKHKDKAAELLQIYSSEEGFIEGYLEDRIFLQDIPLTDDYYNMDISEEYALHLRYTLERSARSYVNESIESRINELWPSYLMGNIGVDELVVSLDEAFERSIEG